MNDDLSPWIAYSSRHWQHYTVVRERSWVSRALGQFAKAGDVSLRVDVRLEIFILASWRLIKTGSKQHLQGHYPEQIFLLGLWATTGELHALLARNLWSRSVDYDG